VCRQGKPKAAAAPVKKNKLSLLKRANTKRLAGTEEEASTAPSVLHVIPRLHRPRAHPAPSRAQEPAQVSGEESQSQARARARAEARARALAE
jgi:hypothetical protein